MKKFVEYKMKQSKNLVKEKSCGAIITIDGWNNNSESRKYLLIRSGRDGLWGFPKGHVIEGESEHETAIREVLEETGLKIKIAGDFRQSIEYTLKNGTLKETVYFTALYIGKGKAEDNVVIQCEEIGEHCWLSYNEALKRLTFTAMKDILTLAHKQIIIEE